MGKKELCKLKQLLDNLPSAAMVSIGPAGLEPQVPAAVLRRLVRIEEAAEQSEAMSAALDVLCEVARLREQLSDVKRERDEAINRAVLAEGIAMNLGMVR